MIVFIMKTFFYSKAKSYSLEQKPHIFYLFLFFCKKMKRVVYVVFTIVIKDLELYLRNLILPSRKITIWFESFAEKRETNKQIIDVLYYQYKKFIL